MMNCRAIIQRAHFLFPIALTMCKLLLSCDRDQVILQDGSEAVAPLRSVSFFPPYSMHSSTEDAENTEGSKADQPQMKRTNTDGKYLSLIAFCAGPLLLWQYFFLSVLCGLCV